jgi:hypothetical protein
VVSLKKCFACSQGLPKRGRRRCPECARVFKGSGWDGIDTHWRARHERIMSYQEFWASLCRAHREPKPRTCPSCRKGIPRTWPCQCPECAQVFKGRGWGGIEAHWKSRHTDVMSYEDFLASLCPAHRGAGDRTTGFLPLGEA